MTQEQKDLLLKDLCARLPYNVAIDCRNEDSRFTCYLTTDMLREIQNNTCYWEYKPYLFPLSSMNEEQKYDFYCRFIENDCDLEDFKEFYLDNGMLHKLFTSLDDIEAIIDWFHKNHFDYRGLIPMGMANDATGLNIKIY